MIRYRVRPAVIILPTRRKVAGILAPSPPPIVYVPRKRKPRRIIRVAAPHNHKRNHIAGIIGRVSTLSLAQAGWAWQPNPIARSRVTQPPAPQAWVWSPNAIIETAIATPAAKSWAWVPGTLVSQRVLTMARKAWNWTANPPAISGITIAYRVVKRAVGLKAKTRFQQN